MRLWIHACRRKHAFAILNHFCILRPLQTRKPSCH